jgi:hypothetical protein
MHSPDDHKHSAEERMEGYGGNGSVQPHWRSVCSCMWDMMPIPRVVLIGGPPCVGKSAAARCIAARYEYGCISTDDIAKAVGSVCSALTGKDLDPMAGMDWRAYFTETPVDVLLDHDAASRERIWPAIDRIVRRMPRGTIRSWWKDTHCGRNRCWRLPSQPLELCGSAATIGCSSRASGRALVSTGERRMRKP